MTPHSPDNLSVIIGASPRVDRLRRRLMRGGIRQPGVATSLPGLRRELHTGEHDLVVSCLLLDEPMLHRDRDALRRLLADTESFRSEFRCVGLVPDVGLMPEAAGLGCHLYVRDPGDVPDAIETLVRSGRMVAARRSRWPSRNVVVPRGAWPAGVSRRFADRFGIDTADPSDSW